MVLKKLNAEDHKSLSDEVSDYLRKNYNMAQQLKKKGEKISELMLHAAREHSRLNRYAKQNRIMKVAETKIIDLLSEADKKLNADCNRARYNGLVPSREMKDAANRYSNVCKQEKEKRNKNLAAAPELISIFYEVLRNETDSIQPYHLDDDEDEIFNKEWNPASIVERMKKL